MSGLLDGRLALVTGGSRGLGAAIGRRFAAEGATVTVLDLETALGSADAWHGARAIGCDVAEEAQVARAIAAAGRIDILVANAGLVPPWRRTRDLDLDEWDRVFAVNVRGMAAVLKHAAPVLRRPGGAVVLMASINAVVSHPQQMLYTATKHAVAGIMRAAALDLGPEGIRVNALAPGPIATQALRGRLAAREAQGVAGQEETLRAFAAQTALGRMATEDDVAGAALFLACDLSAGVTGKLLPVEAGLVP